MTHQGHIPHDKYQSWDLNPSSMTPESTTWTAPLGTRLVAHPLLGHAQR